MKELNDIEIGAVSGGVGGLIVPIALGLAVAAPLAIGAVGVVGTSLARKSTLSSISLPFLKGSSTTSKEACPTPEPVETTTVAACPTTTNTCPTPQQTYTCCS